MGHGADWDVAVLVSWNMVSIVEKKWSDELIETLMCGVIACNVWSKRMGRGADWDKFKERAYCLQRLLVEKRMKRGADWDVVRRLFLHTFQPTDKEMTLNPVVVLITSSKNGVLRKWAKRALILKRLQGCGQNEWGMEPIETCRHTSQPVYSFCLNRRGVEPIETYPLSTIRRNLFSSKKNGAWSRLRPFFPRIVSANCLSKRNGAWSRLRQAAIASIALLGAGGNRMRRGADWDSKVRMTSGSCFGFKWKKNEAWSRLVGKA